MPRRKGGSSAKKKKKVSREPKHKCLRCKKIMVKVEVAPATNVVVRVPWRTFFKHSRAYVCPECGFVELYVA